MILFLDFDGVLHPDPCYEEARLFENAPRLAAALEPFAEVAIVLSTSWRVQCTLPDLLLRLPEVLRERVLGVTPFVIADVPARMLPYRRQAECVQWLHGSGETSRPWLALDDRGSLFEPYCERLILCESQRGFGDETRVRLQSALTRARLKASRDVDARL